MQIPREPTHYKIPLMFLFLLYFLLFLPTLLSNQIPFFMDIVTQFFPIKAYIGEQWQRLRFPLWNPTYYGGVPLLANPQWGVLYPGNFPFFFCRTGWMFTLTLVLHALVAAYGVWLLARRFSCSLCCLLAPLVFLFGGYLWAHYAFGAYLLTLAWMPFILWAYDRFLADQRSVHIIVAGVLSGGLLLAGAPQLAFYFFMAFIFVALFYPIINRHSLWYSIRFLLLSALVGCCIALPQIFAIIESSNEIGRQSGLALAEILPGTLSTRQYPAVFLGGTSPGIEDAETTAYLGFPALFLLLIGLVHIISAPRRERLFTYAILSLILLIFASRILAPLLYHFFPFYAKFHDPKRVLGVVMIFFPMIIVRGAEILLLERSTLRKHLFTGISCIILFLLLMILFQQKQHFTQFPLGVSQLGWINLPAFIHPIYLSLIFLLLMFIIFGVHTLIRKNRVPFFLTACISLILLLDLSHFAFRRIDIKMVPAKWLFSNNLVPASLLATQSTYRYITYDSTLNFSYDYLREDFPCLLLPNCGSYYGLQDFQGYDPWKPERYVRYLALLNRGFIVPYQRHFGLVRNLWWSPLLQRACVKFIIGDAGNYYLPLFPPAALLPSKDITKQLEQIIKSKKLTLTFSFNARESAIERELLLIKILRLDGSAELELILGNTPDSFQHVQGQGEIVNRTFTSKPFSPGSKIHTYKWEIESKKPMICAAVSVVNLSKRHPVWLYHLAFKPEDTPNQFSLISGDNNLSCAVWELQDYVFPVISFARSAMVASSLTESEQLLAGLGHNSADTVIIEDIWRQIGNARYLTFSPEAQITSLDYRGSYIKVEVENLNAPALLVVRQAYFKHWRANVDGKSTFTFPADLMFLGIYVPAGAKQVEIYYLPLWLTPVLVFSFLCLMATVFLIFKKFKAKE